VNLPEESRFDDRFELDQCIDEIKRLKSELAEATEREQRTRAAMLSLLQPPLLGRNLADIQFVASSGGYSSHVVKAANDVLAALADAPAAQPSEAERLRKVLQHIRDVLNPNAGYSDVAGAIGEILAREGL
jgi:hypothetical protein